MPSPCGLNSQCRTLNQHAVCSCLPTYIGAPPNCRPECIVSSECPLDKSCINQKCKDPCPGTCGQNAKCQVVNHNPICSCNNGYTGDPFVRCVIEQSKLSPISQSHSLSLSLSFSLACAYSMVHCHAVEVPSFSIIDGNSPSPHATSTSMCFLYFLFLRLSLPVRM